MADIDTKQSLRAERDQWRYMAMNKLDLMVSTAVRAKEVEIAVLRAERDAAIAREKALLEGNQINREILVRHNADHFAEVNKLRAEIGHLRQQNEILRAGNLQLQRDVRSAVDPYGQD